MKAPRFLRVRLGLVSGSLFLWESFGVVYATNIKKRWWGPARYWWTKFFSLTVGCFNIRLAQVELVEEPTAPTGPYWIGARAEIKEIEMETRIIEMTSRTLAVLQVAKNELIFAALGVENGINT